MTRLNKLFLASTLGALVSSPFALANDIICNFSHINNHYSLKAKGSLFGNIRDVSVGYENGDGAFLLEDILSVSFTEPMLYQSVTTGDGRVFNKYEHSYIAVKINMKTEKTLIGHHPLPGGPTKEIVELPILCKEVELIRPPRKGFKPPPFRRVAFS